MKTIGFKLPEVGHNVRGIGFYAHRLLIAMQKLAKSHNLKIETFKSTPPDTADLDHYPHLDLFQHTLPIYKPHKTVVSILDVIPLEYPSIFPPGAKGGFNIQLQKYALRSVSHVLTISQYSKNKIVKFLGISPDKITVTVLAADPIFKKISTTTKLEALRKKYSLPQKFVLYVGDVNWNKNISRLIKATERVDIPFVIVGRQALEIEELLNHAPSGPRDRLRKLLGKTHPELKHLNDLKELFEKKHLKRIGFLQTQELVGIYNLASVYCQPSIVEGFGLPLLEAMACGTPCISSNSSSLPEIGGDSVEYFDPLSEDALVKTLQKVISDKKLSLKLSAKGPKQAKFFSWNQTAALTIDTYLKYL